VYGGGGGGGNLSNATLLETRNTHIQIDR